MDSTQPRVDPERRLPLAGASSDIRASLLSPAMKNPSSRGCESFLERKPGREGYGASVVLLGEGQREGCGWIRGNSGGVSG